MQQIIVRHLSGVNAGRVETFGVEPGGVLTIGRDPESNIRLDSYRDGTVSRHHARIIAHATGTIWLELVDRESTNGTFLNTRWLRGRIALVPGDRIRLGVGGPELEFDLGAEGEVRRERGEVGFGPNDLGEPDSAPSE